MGGGVECEGWVVMWLLSLCLPVRRPLGPRTSIMICELVNEDNDKFAGVEFWGHGWAMQKPVGLQDHLEGA